MESTAYKLYKEEGRLTIVIDNPTQETAELVYKFFGTGIKDMTGFNPVKQEELHIPQNPDVEKRSEENNSSQEEKEANCKTAGDLPASMERDESSKNYSYEEILDIVKSNEKIAKLGSPLKVAVILHPHMSENDVKMVLVSMCGKTKEEIATEEGFKNALSQVVNSKDEVRKLANGYVRVIRARNKKKE